MNPWSLWEHGGPLVARSADLNSLPQVAHLTGDGHYVVTWWGIVVYRVLVQGDQVHVA